MVSLIYSTVGNVDAAKRIARSLVEEHLVACVNILPSVTSVYRWKGKMEEDTECVLIAKTVEKKVEQAIQKIRSLHPYEIPDIVAVPVTSGLKEYLAYIEDETR